MKPKEGLLIVLSSPSGGGKTTLCNRLMEADGNVVRSISCTTRPPRGAEQEGRDYYFLTRDDFEKRVAHGEFLEHAQVHGHYYGTLRKTVEELLATGRDALLNIDVQGAAIVCKLAKADPRLRRALVSVFLMPPSLQLLEQRLRKRGTDTEATIARRLAEARREMACWREYDYVIVSGSIEEDYRRMQAILNAERCRTSRQSFKTE
ncbi:MAG: guanylate kinase [Verrucomicrobia bacterium]|nr:guanylate kinase [Verrucomicrobiota bacterium]